jgi:hypothetical protein
VFNHELVCGRGLLRFLFCITVAPELVWKRAAFARPVLYHSFANELVWKGAAFAFPVLYHTQLL